MEVRQLLRLQRGGGGGSCLCVLGPELPLRQLAHTAHVPKGNFTRHSNRNRFRLTVAG